MGNLESKYLRTWVLVTKSLRVLKACCWGLSNDHSVSFSSSLRSGAVFSERLAMNLPRYAIMPMNLWRSFLELGGGMSLIAKTFCGSGLIPCSETS